VIKKLVEDKEKTVELKNEVIKKQGRIRKT
jgi:hypothetical protein